MKLSMKLVMALVAILALVAGPAQARKAAEPVEPDPSYLEAAPIEVTVAPGETVEAENLAGTHFRFKNKVKLVRKAGPITAYSIPVYEWGPAGVRACSVGGCWAWSEETSAGGFRFNHSQSWAGPKLWIHPYGCSGHGFSCTVLHYAREGWNPATANTGQFVNAVTYFQVDFAYHGSPFSEHHREAIRYWPDGTISYVVA